MNLLRLFAFIAALCPLAAPAQVRVEIFEFPMKGDSLAIEAWAGNDSDAAKEDGGADASWEKMPAVKTEEFSEPAFALAALPQKYTPSGVRADRSRPFLVRLTGAVTLPAGEHVLHLRALTGTRVSWDGAVIAETPLKRAKSGDAEAVPDQAALQLVPTMPLLPPGHVERQVRVQGDGLPHAVIVETFVGGKAIRPELGELFVASAPDGESFRLLPGIDGEWKEFVAAQRERIAKLEAQRRRDRDEDAYWIMRHDLAREHAKPAPRVPELPDGFAARNEIDVFLAAKMGGTGRLPSPVIDDATFLRRAWLDTTGRVPPEERVRDFLASTASEKRAREIDLLLARDDWADHWTSYWQDALAENPNILKGTLNNTGPFRWWIHEALLDNLGADRFVTTLIAMEGSTNYGGPAGFALASQNDLPMAAKAQIVASAFLGREMKCARCHDAPSHPVDQADLFGLAAMLGRAPVKVPASSLTKGLSENSHVTVSLRPGELIDPHWPLATAGAPLPGVLRHEGDTRELLAATLTDPRGDRFAKVMANRLWARLMGFGIVDPVDDWESVAPSHPELLAWLAHELITHDYDMKHLARLIMNSHAYQRAPTAESSRRVKASQRLFTAPARRRMTAEQLADSLLAVSGIALEMETLTFDPEGRQSARDHSNLGVPRRAWEFASLSNERDRPALAKPHASIVTDVLATFGWRESRAEPRTARDDAANVLQPALLANGTLGLRITRLSDDSAFTALALRDQTLSDLVRAVFARVLSREPSAAELGKFCALLAPGYDARKTGAPAAPAAPRNTKAVSWANHLNPDATSTILEVEKEVKAGPPPTPRLTSDWRERMEDALWALLISPEFVYVP